MEHAALTKRRAKRLGYKGDIKSLEDLTYEKTKQFLSQHKLPKGIQLISFRSEANVGPGVISMMSHIAHVELPKLSFLGNTYDESEYEVGPAEKLKKSDGLVTCRDAEVPGSVVVHPNQKLDHAWMVYSSWNKNQAGADASEMCKALLTMLVELGKADNFGTLHLLLRYGEKSDGLVTCRDAEVPGSVVVCPNQMLDHAWKVYSSWNKNQAGADASEMCEALLTMLGDIKSLEDLTYEKRKQFFSQHKLPKGIPLISFRSKANVGPGVISKMSHIAHVELPKLSFLGNTSDESEYEVGPAEKHRVPLVVPVSAAMALSSLHLQLRYGEKSDGLVTCRDAEVPGSVVVRPNQKLDHAWKVYSSWNKNQAGADASEMCKALLTMLVELGKGDIKSLEDLTYEKRKQFLSQHKLPKGIPLISFRSEANVGPRVISMMSHIAHVELPKLSFLGNTSDECEYEVGPAEKHRVPLVVPVSAAMALSALYLQLRYGEKCDGLVTCRDAEVPGSVVVHPNQKLDPAWMVYSSWNKNQAVANASEICEALLTMLVELGKADNSGNMEYAALTKRQAKRLSIQAYVELPKLSFLGNTSDESEYKVGPAEKHRVPQVVLVSAAMDLSALHLQLCYGEECDGLVTCRDAEVPGSVVVHPNQKLDHAWKGDLKSLEDLTYEKRKQFLSQHKLPKGILLISFRSKANVGPGVISMMSHIAHVGLPKLSFLGNTSDESEEKSDGLVTCRDAEAPGSVVVRPNQKLDHAWKGDIKSLEDLNYEKRKQFLSQQKLPKRISLISFRSKSNVGPGVISMMSHIAHAELPKISFLGNMFDESEYEKSDGLVTCRDAEVPGSVVVHPNPKLDHAWMVYSSRNKNQAGADASEMCEALLPMLVELGKADNSGS
uniref:Alpha/beta hydrolase fold protein n=1 Tax=Tanacetum cinerariifolium TaxID=118510 RepID=A0A6L2LMM3_TANCI|nr:alpha/beta hydrolase fold protein [Tanacetum cinerariifolium]